jgi:hypothetical protein
VLLHLARAPIEVETGFHNLTNITQNTSDHLTKTHALVETGLHNLTSILKNVSVEFAAGLQNISKVCANN